MRDARLDPDEYTRVANQGTVRPETDGAPELGDWMYDAKSYAARATQEYLDGGARALDYAKVARDALNRAIEHMETSGW